jgi:hypothetical protein
MKRPKKTPPSRPPHPAYAKAFARLDEAVSKATTPSDLSGSEKLDLIRLRLFGRIVD